MQFKSASVNKKVALGLAITFGLLPFPSQARQAVEISAPFEVGESPAGNYLSARVAEAEHDTLAASTFLRESLALRPAIIAS